MDEPWDEVEARRVMMDRIVRATSDAVGERFVAEPEAVDGRMEPAQAALCEAVDGRMEPAQAALWDAVYRPYLEVPRE